VRKSVLILGILLALLGGLWVVQGLGLVSIEPIACVTNCTPVEGPVLSWVIAGAAAILAGVLAIFWSMKSRTK
jgi:hypothetical protein